MTTVVDSSAVVAALLDSGIDGDWSRGLLGADDLAAPDHLMVEVSNVLRRVTVSGLVSPDVAVLAHADLVDLPVTLFPFRPLAQRVWALHPSMTAYDAAFVALAEFLDSPLVTLDRRLSRAAGARCRVVVPPGPGVAGI